MGCPIVPTIYRDMLCFCDVCSVTVLRFLVIFCLEELRRNYYKRLSETGTYISDPSCRERVQKNLVLRVKRPSFPTSPTCPAIYYLWGGEFPKTFGRYFGSIHRSAHMIGHYLTKGLPC